METDSIKVPVIDRTAPSAFLLTEQDRQALMQMSQSYGYRVFLKICETKCYLQDNVLLSVDPGDEKKILGEHAVSVAKWAFFAEVQKQVEFEVKEIFHSQKAEAANRLRQQEEASGDFV